MIRAASLICCALIAAGCDKPRSEPNQPAPANFSMVLDQSPSQPSAVYVLDQRNGAIFRCRADSDHCQQLTVAAAGASGAGSLSPAGASSPSSGGVGRVAGPGTTQLPADIQDIINRHLRK